jgi:hypothetical protein
MHSPDQTTVQLLAFFAPAVLKKEHFQTIHNQMIGQVRQFLNLIQN